MNFKAVLITAWIWFPALATAYETKSGSYLVCKSPECTERAKLLNESLNITIDPCTDFYSYVCGKWESTHPLPSGRGSYDVYQEIGEDIPQKMSYILGNRTVVERNQSIIDKVANMYKACLAFPDTSDTFVRVLKESGFNAWPILTEGNIFNSSNCTDLLHHMSISAIGHVELSGEPYKRSTKPKQIFIKHIPLQETIKQKVRNISAVIKNTIKFLKPGIDSSMLENLTKELVEFSKRLSDMIDGSYSSIYKISSLQAAFPNIPMSDLLEKEFGKVNITLYDTDQLNVYVTYYQDLNRFLATAKPKTLYNYAGFLAVFPYVEYVNMANEEATMRGRNWRECIALLDENARDILDYLYVTNDTNHAAIKNEVEDITSRVIQTFNETLRNNRWIDNASREAFEKELKEAPLGIGYPDELLNMSVLETFYKYVPHVTSNISYTESLYYFRQNSYKMQLRTFRYPEESNWRWLHSSREDRRKFHETFGRNIEIPYRSFNSPIFQQGLPRSLNYGGIGGTIARELGSTFSINGIQRILHPKHKAFFALAESRTSCFDEEYIVANKKMLLEHDRSEVPEPWAGTDQALADNTGLQTAFKAYAKVLEEECTNVDTRLTSLENITGMQLFFISNAMTQCRIVDKDTLIKEIKGSDTPARNRVNEAMKNLKAFATAFNCSLGSPMHPNNTCSFW